MIVDKSGMPFIVSTSTSAYFANAIVEHLGVGNIVPVAIERKTFRGGEKYQRLEIRRKETLIGRDAVVVGSTHTDEDFLELLRICRELKTAYGVNRMVVAIPYFGYARSDRAVIPGELVIAKSNAVELSNLPGAEKNFFLLLDLHQEGILHYFEGPCFRTELYAEPVLSGAMAELANGNGRGNLVIGTADLGRTKWVQTYAKIMQAGIAFVVKEKVAGKSRVMATIGDVAGKVVAIFDDMYGTGDTLVGAAEAYLEAGAQSVHAVVSHFAAADTAAIDRLLTAPLASMSFTNSHPMSQHELVRSSAKFRVKDVSRVFAELICSILADSTLGYKGEREASGKE